MSAMGMMGLGSEGRVLLVWAHVYSFADVSAPTGPVVVWINYIVPMAIGFHIWFNFVSVQCSSSSASRWP
jgi:hypothetical protein